MAAFRELQGMAPLERIQMDMNAQARRHAVEAAYAAHADDVYRLAYALLGDADEAAEATQDAFVHAFEHWHRYDPGRPLRPWLHAIASRVSLDRLRRRKVRRLAIPAITRQAGSAAGDEYGGRDPASTVTGRQAVEEALAGLSPVARAAVVLRHRYGYEYAEIGAFLGLSVGNVGSVLSRARASIRSRLQHDEPAVREQGA